MAFRVRAASGPTFNAGLVALSFFKGPRGGGGGGSGPPVPTSGSAHASYLEMVYKLIHYPSNSMFSLILGKIYGFLVGRYYVDTVILVLTFEKKKKLTIFKIVYTSKSRN